MAKCPSRGILVHRCILCNHSAYDGGGQFSISAGKTAVLIDRAVKHILTAFCAILLLLLMVVFTVYSVVMRYVFEPPLYGAIYSLY